MNLDRNDIKMSTIEQKFYYNGNNVTAEVVATLTVPDVFSNVFGPFYKVVKATAKCHPDDAYSVAVGEKMALARAEAKAYTQLANEMNRRWHWLEDALKALTPLRYDFMAKAANCVEHNEKYVAELPNKQK